MNIFFYNFFLNENKSGYKTKESHLINKYPEIHEKIIKFCDNDFLKDLPFKQKIWHFIHQEKTQINCLECGKPLEFKRSLKEGYGKYCSLTCTNKNKNHIEKVKTTNKEKYGGVTPIHSENIINKIKSTNKEKYGVENPFQRTDLVENGFLKKYGVKHVSKVEGVSEKKKLTNIEKYGKSTILSTTKVLSKTHDTRRKYFIEKYNNFNFNIHTGDTLNILCQECNKNYNIDRDSFRYRVSVNINPCTLCNPLNESSSIQEKELQTFIRSIVGDECLINDRTVIKPKELDIVIPNKNLAIEFNGIYWHSEFFVDKNYHLTKYLTCKTKGIDLIQIFQDEWVYKKDIVKSIIKSKLNLYDKTIYARNCQIKEIPSKIYKNFCDKNHIQGHVKSKIKIGLLFNNELVSIMSFGGLRRSLGSNKKDGSYEMLRFCNKINTRIIGGASKLFNFFLKNYNPKEVISYSDNRYFTGNLYKTLGFTQQKETKPNYFYITDHIKRENRFKYRKDVLVKQGFDPNKTENQIMLERGIPKIWDCGNKKWVFINTEVFKKN